MNKKFVKIGDCYFDVNHIIAFKPIYATKDGRVDINHIMVYLATGEIVSVPCEDADGNWGRAVYDNYVSTLVDACTFGKSNLICETKNATNGNFIV